MDIHWNSIFVPQGSLFEIVLRGTIVYLSLFAIFRLASRVRENLSYSDILVLVLIADAVQNSMVGEAKTVTEGIVLAATIVFWSYAIEALQYFFPALQNVLEHPPLLVIKDGKMLPKNMRKAFLTQQELMTKLRQQGFEDLGSIRRAFIEDDGGISFLRNEKTCRPEEKK